MSIKIPYVPGWLRAETLAWGDMHGAEFCQLEQRDDAYFDRLQDWWFEEGDLVIVEHDILPRAGAVEEMLACEQPWCACWYMIHPVTEHGRSEEAVPFGMGLGCTKFSHHLRHANPELAQLAGEPIDFGPEQEPDGPRHWSVLDMRLCFRLMRIGYLPHDHGEARHLSG